VSDQLVISEAQSHEVDVMFFLYCICKKYIKYKEWLKSGPSGRASLRSLW